MKSIKREDYQLQSHRLKHDTSGNIYAFLFSWRTALAEYDFRIERENRFLVGLFYQNTLVFARP